MTRMIFLVLLCASFSLRAEEVHEFAGKHFIASYLHCDERAISDVKALQEAMDRAVGGCGATVLDKAHYVFAPNGLTAVYLLSESHASIHTYPEYGACFVDLFTCGSNCSAERFDAAMRSYLKPETVNARFFERSEEIGEIPYRFHEQETP